jgi:phenylpropionate dioxygenase-like ring-hydroxylating dioxygenase large terminal subunit
MKPEASAYLEGQIDFEFRRYQSKGPPPSGFEPLPDIPTGRYIDDAFFALEREHIWSKSWLLAAHRDELPEQGSFLLWERSGVPILLVRGRDDEIRAFYNSCPHRGGPLVREASGQTGSFVCKYHCWAFRLDGTLLHIPDEHEFGPIDKSRRGLRPIRCESFGNFVFVNRDPNAQPLNDFLGPMTTEFEDFGPSDLRFVAKYDYVLPVNWKITMDAFQEVYHLKHIHPKSVDQAIDHRGASMALFPNGHSRMMVPGRSGKDQFVPSPPASALEDDPRQLMARSGSLSYNMFPNIVTPTGVEAFPLLLFWPLRKDETLFEVIWLSRGEDIDKDSAWWKTRIRVFNAILDEDNENLPWIQRSIASGAIDGIPLSYQERRIYHFHEYVDHVIGVDRISEALRGAPRLREMEEVGAGNRVR